MLETLNANNHAITITGKPVAKAKTGGNKRPVELASVSGISPPKYSTAPYGQKANANKTPNKKAFK